MEHQLPAGSEGGVPSGTGIGRYKKLRVIGSGSYGKVYKVKCLDDSRQYVMKRVTLAQNSDADKRQALLEVEVLSSLRHPHIVPYKECFWDEDEMDLCMVMDYCEGGDLYHYVQTLRKIGQKIDEEEAWIFMIQMMFALAYLHAKKILHRDVKSQNIFLSNGRCQLGDFGLAKKLEESFELARTPIGTPFYMAPEIMEGKPYAFKSDVWALGCVMYEVLTGKPAFAANNFPGVAMKVLSGNYEPISDEYSQDLREAVSCMLCNNVNSRPFIFQLIESPSILSRAQTYLRDLEVEHVQAGLGTWRGTIPIQTLEALPRYDCDGCSDRKYIDRNTVTGLDHPCSSSLLTHWRNESGVYTKSGIVLENESSAHVPCTEGSEKQCSLHNQLTLHASELHLDISEVAVETYLVNQGYNRPKTAEASENAYEINPLSSLVCVPNHGYEQSESQEVASSTSLPEDTALGENIPETYPEDLSHTMPKPCYDASNSKQYSVSGVNSLGSAVNFPWRESTFLTQSSALTDEERQALQSQLDQLACISERVRLAGISDNSGDLFGCDPGISSCNASSLAAPSNPTGQQKEVLKPEEPEVEEYEDDFEEEDDPFERCRSEWMEQQRRHAVQRLWNIEAAEAVPEEIYTVTGTPHALSSSDDEAAAAEDDKESVEDEEVSHGFPPSTSAHQTFDRRSEVQRRLAEREQKLRARCIEQLGKSTYNKLYDFLRNHAKLYSEDHDVAMSIELSEFLDETEMAFWPLVDELVYFDETVRREQIG